MYKRDALLAPPGGLSWQSIQFLISAQVMISRFVGLSPMSGSARTAQSLLGILSPSLYAPYHTHTLSFSLSLKMNK